MKVAIYTRVSTHNKVTTSLGLVQFSQDPEVQEIPLRRWATENGWDLFNVYSDRSSGARESRPALDSLVADAQAYSFDAVLVFRFDRLSRNAKHMFSLLEEFNDLGIRLLSYRETIDTSTPSGKAMFGVIAIMSEFERNIAGERVKAGMSHARSNGVRIGRPTNNRVDAFEIVYLRDRDGMSWDKIAKRLNSNTGTIRRVYKKQKGIL